MHNPYRAVAVEEHGVRIDAELPEGLHQGVLVQSGDLERIQPAEAPSNSVAWWI